MDDFLLGRFDPVNEKEQYYFECSKKVLFFSSKYSVKSHTLIWFSKHVNNFNYQENTKLKATSFTQTATTLKNK